MIKYILALLLTLHCFNVNAQEVEIIENDTLISVLNYYNSSFTPFFDKKLGEDKIKNRMSKIIKNDFNLNQVGNSELFEIQYGKQSFFTTPNIDYIFTGKIVKLSDNSFSKMFTNSQKGKLNRDLLRLYSDGDFIKYTPSIEKKGDIFVFIDYSCPFCLKFHTNNLKRLLEFGYQVNYIPFLKNPENKKIENQMKSIFCMKDNEYKKNLIDEAFSNPKQFTNKKLTECNEINYIDNLFSITNYFDFKGTPVVLLYNGNFVEGYVPFNSLILELESNK